MSRCWWSGRTSRRSRWASSSPTPKPIPASSISVRPESATPAIWPPNCSSSRPASTSSTCPTRARWRLRPECSSGQVQMFFGDIGGMLPLIRQGQLRALALSGESRSPELPGPADHDRERRAGLRGADLHRRGGAGRHAAASIGLLNAAINKALRTPEVTAAAVRLNADIASGSGAGVRHVPRPRAGQMAGRGAAFRCRHPLGARTVMEDHLSAWDVRFSNRPVGVKRFQTIHRCGVDVARGLVLLSGIGTKALPSWDSRTRRNDLRVGLAIRRTAGPSGHTISPHPSSREGHHSTTRWSSSFLLLMLHGAHAAAVSRVHRNSVPSTQMRCMITASRRARATIAFFNPRRLAICIAQALSQDHFVERTSMMWAAS